MSISEALWKQEQDVDTHFRDLLQTDPVKAQAVATLGLYKALNTLVRMLAHTSDLTDIS